MKRLIKNMVGVLVVLLASTAVQAKLQLVENFDSLATGNPDGLACTGVMGGTWDSQGEGTGNVRVEDNSGSKVLQFRSHSSGARRGIGFNGITNPITEGETGTVFLRFWFRTNPSELPRTYIGLISDTSDNPVTGTSTDTPTDFIAGFGLLDNGSGGFNVTTIDGSTVLKVDLVRAQWYNIWIEANNEIDTFDLYLSEADGPAGDATLPTPDDLVKSGIPFGNPTIDPLNGMIFACPTGTGQSTRTYVDEIWWDGDQGLKPPTKARKPSPFNGAPDVPRNVVLSWTPGQFAAKHNVYFGTSLDDVTNADVASPLLVGPAQDANAYDPEHLELDQTYYWRIDEVNAPPDSTIFKGDVWSFTTEPVAYAIGNITAIASSSDVGREPENTINGSGLDDSGLLHSKDPENNMWLSTMAGPQPSWIEYEFDNVYKLHEMWVWNSNDSLEPVLGLGFKDVTIEYSVNGTDYTTLGTTHEFARAPGMPDYAHNTTVDMGGVGAKYVRLTANSNWGGVLNQYGLSEVRFLYIPVQAREPNPDSGATDVDPDVTLSWRAGREAAQHDVYLGSDEQAVIDGTVSATTVTETNHGPLSLDLGQTYSWKINDVNMAETATTWEGDVWDFSTSEFIVVDDFESYNDLDPTDPDSNRIFNAWIDGYEQPTNGALVGYDQPPFVETTIVHGDVQSMPFFYSNTGGATYSEAERTFAAPQDWTKYGIQTLVLYFHGTPGNTGQLYV
ncbi:MAG: discoidin domain-containing protein, partial [Planctomycetota bacterium]